jgi:hypothetical protein
LFRLCQAAKPIHYRLEEKEMKITAAHSLNRILAMVAAATLLAACAEKPSIAPEEQPAIGAEFATLPGPDTVQAVATLRRATNRYHNLSVAVEEGFVLLHKCESRPGEGPIGTVYVNPNRLLDGVIDPEVPDALIYEPTRNGRPTLVGVEFAIPYTLWPQPQPPTFLGATFQTEDEFGVYALHAWVWRYNPKGLFAERNPRVSCEPA